MLVWDDECLICITVVFLDATAAGHRRCNSTNLLFDNGYYMFFQQLSLCCLHKHNTQLLTMNIPHAGLRAFSYCAKKISYSVVLSSFPPCRLQCVLGKIERVRRVRWQAMLTLWRWLLRPGGKKNSTFVGIVLVTNVKLLITSAQN